MAIGRRVARASGLRHRPLAAVIMCRPDRRPSRVALGGYLDGRSRIVFAEPSNHTGVDEGGSAAVDNIRGGSVMVSGERCRMMAISVRVRCLRTSGCTRSVPSLHRSGFLPDRLTGALVPPSRILMSLPPEQLARAKDPSAVLRPTLRPCW